MGFHVSLGECNPVQLQQTQAAAWSGHGAQKLAVGRCLNLLLVLASLAKGRCRIEGQGMECWDLLKLLHCRDLVVSQDRVTPI